MSLSFLFFSIDIEHDNVIVIFVLFHLDVLLQKKLLFLFFLSFIFSVNKYHHHRCIWSDVKITWAKQLEKKKDHLPKERTIFAAVNRWDNFETYVCKRL
jgi:hypothetical protein